MGILAIGATFTAEPIADTLAFWNRELGWDYTLRFAPYNQVFQQLLDPTGLFAENRDGINIALVRLEDLGGPENVRHFEETVRAASFSVPLLIVVCPASPETAFVSRLESAGNAYLVTPEEINALYPVADYHDSHGDQLGHLPYTPEFFAALGTMLMRKVHAIRMKPWKAIALDCDETLWRGVCGEDGPAGIRIDPPHGALQKFMAAQHDAGMLLCLCSRNSEEDVFDTFRVHPEMPLSREHFIAARVNWAPKSVNLISLAEELDLGLDTFIQVEDNPAECAEIEASCPEVLTVPLPSDPERIPRFLRHIWAFDHLRTTEADRNRTALYAQRQERGRLQKEAPSLRDFLASLQLEVRISAMSEDEIPRVAQLTQRTNQMNFATVRRSEAEIRNLLLSPEWRCLTVHVSDRFGDYGLTGVLLCRRSDDALMLDTFLLSCRALGKGVEHRMLATVGETAQRENLATVKIHFVPTARNRPALDLLKGLASEFEEMPSAALAALTWEPPDRPAAREPAARSAAPSRSAVDYVRIATELSEPRRILDCIRGRGRESESLAPPRTALEAQLAAVWAELLNVSEVGVDDNFFDLGGHSLLAVQLLSRVRQALGVDLTLNVVYTGNFTVAEMARAIEYADLETLSDDEVRELLAD